MTSIVELDATDRQLLQHLQDAFPLDRSPWRIVGERLGLSEEEVLGRVRRLAREGVVRSIGPVIEARHVGLGASTLIGLSVPEERLVDVARTIGEHPGVSHCYERYHPYNLWFTLSMPDESGMNDALRRLLARCRRPPSEVLNLPVRRRFKVDVRYRFTDRVDGGQA